MGNIPWDEHTKEHKEYGFGGKNARAHYRAIVVHEITHAFITDVIVNEPHKSDINRYDSLYTPLLDSMMQEQGYGDWWGFVNEHLVRTAHVRILERMDKKEAAELREEDVKEAGFVLEPDTEELMKEYESNRNKYKTIDDFLPLLIRQLGTFNRQYIDDKLKALQN